VTAPATAEPLVATVARRAGEEPARVAMRKKHLGRWRTYTWSEVAQRTASAAGGLAELGIGPGARVALLADNRPAWLLADLAVQALGAVTVGLDPELDAAEVDRLLASSGATVVVAEDEEQLDKLAGRPGAGGVEHVVVIDPRGVELDGHRARAFADLEAAGRHHPVDLAAAAERLDPDGPVALAGTAEPDGPAEAALLTHRDLADAADAAAAAFGLDGRTELLSHVSLARAAERVVSEAGAVRHGAVVSFPESPASFPRDLHDVQPTFLLGGPHLWAGLRAEVEGRMASAGRTKSAAYRWAIAGGSGGLRSLLVHRPLRRRLGLARTATAACTAAPAAEDLAWVRALGIDLRDEPFRPLVADRTAVAP
jgi:long-chain acyl-CoA synthetase